MYESQLKIEQDLSVRPKTMMLLEKQQWINDKHITT